MYFDLWPDCVVGWSLTGVVVRLGNYEVENVKDRKEERERIGVGD